MGRRLPALCCGRAATRVRKRVQRVSYSSSSSSCSKLPAVTSCSSGKVKNAAAGPGGWHGSGASAMADVGKKDGGGQRVMVVADGRADAVEWALSQAVRSNDAVVLLAVVKPAAADAGVDSCVKISRTRCYQHLDAMRSLCESTRPEVRVEVCVVEAAERAPAVVDAARRHGASLLVLCQRRRPAAARWLLAPWRRRRGAGGGGGSLVEHCIEHAPCVALGVRRRSSGGYLVSSKRHKDFWLLA